MREMIDHIASAICRGHKYNPDEPSSDDYKAARLVLEAMREPTKAMESKAMQDDDTSMPMARSYDEVWKSMIDGGAESRRTY